jgi:hypothetical protein
MTSELGVSLGFWEWDLERGSQSQFAFSGARIWRTSIERRPWEVSRITSGETPISLPILLGFSLWSVRKGYVDSRFPMLLNGGRGIDYGAIHVEEEAGEAHF